MKKNLVLLAIVCFTVFILSSCKKSCECKLWTNNTIGQPYSVDLEGDGSQCNEYSSLDTSAITINGSDTLGGLVSGIECYDK
jgi:hypothetical protein